MKKQSEFEKIKSEKSEKFLSDWINNKYCLEKKELNLICWPYVVSGGNVEFCPYFKPNIEFQNDENEKQNSAKNKISPTNSSKKLISDIHQNYQNKPNIHKICPLFHISRPITEVPIFLRIFEVEDFFPIARYEKNIFFSFFFWSKLDRLCLVLFCFLFVTFLSFFFYYYSCSNHCYCQYFR